MDAGRSEQATRLATLDGWRAISILLVLATHMLPLGPKVLRLNEASGPAGMALFFTLSGFLITKQLYEKRDIVAFCIRRSFRIVPLAYVYLAAAMLTVSASGRQWLSHLLFAINYDQQSATALTGHFWSVCVEVHFYVAIGLLMTLTRFRGFRALLPLWLLFTAGRFVLAPGGTIETHYMVDEILAGSCLALVYLGELGSGVRRFVSNIPILIPLALLALASHPATGVLNAFRGLAASVLVGHTLFRYDRYAILNHRVLSYVARISYALYVVHPASMYGWLGSGATMVKYAKRPIAFAITFLVAHLSTFHFESIFMRLSKRLTERRTVAHAARVG